MSEPSSKAGEPNRTGSATQNAEKEARASGAVRNYMMFGFAGLLSMVPILLLKGMDLWCIFPLVLGALSLMAYWRAGPIFVLLSLVFMIELRSNGLDPFTAVMVFLQQLFEGRHSSLAGLSIVAQTPFLDFLLGVCVLAFLAGHYRLQALVHNVIPLEARTHVPAAPRVQGQPVTEPINPRRSPGLVTRWEIPLLGAATLLSGLAADYSWNLVHGLRPGFGMRAEGWQVITCAWTLALLLFSAWAVFGYVARMRMTAAESLLYLQDLLWRQTRREQSRISRWIAWARCRSQRRKEGMP